MQAAAQDYADHAHITDATAAIGEEAVPATDPHWGYQVTQAGRRNRDYMLRCLIAGMEAAAHKSVNYDKLREIAQGHDENPATFLNHLTEAMQLHTRLSPKDPAGTMVLATHFITQSAPDIRKKLKSRTRPSDPSAGPGKYVN